MKRVLLFLAIAALAGCEKQPPEVQATATCESMPEAGDDAPMEEMPDDDQGIIYI